MVDGWWLMVDGWWLMVKRCTTTKNLLFGKNQWNWLNWCLKPPQYFQVKKSLGLPVKFVEVLSLFRAILLKVREEVPKMCSEIFWKYQMVRSTNSKTQLEISERLGFVEKNNLGRILSLCDEVRKMTFTLIKKYADPKT